LFAARTLFFPIFLFFLFFIQAGRGSEGADSFGSAEVPLLGDRLDWTFVGLSWSCAHRFGTFCLICLLMFCPFFSCFLFCPLRMFCGDKRSEEMLVER
jgi:hypothetical protein